MRKALIAIMFFIAVLLSAGCLTYDVRQELPTKIEVTEKPVTPIESPIECKTASCLTLVKEVSQKNTKWECAPPFKGANDDPVGSVYYSDKGDMCRVLPAPDTLCLQYDCSFNKETSTGYYKMYYACGGGGSIDNWGYGFGIAYPNENINLISTIGIGSVGALPGNLGFACNAISSESRGKGYNTLCDYQDGCYTCVDTTIFLGYEPRSCPAEMPIIYPYNAKGFKYNPVIDTSANPGKNVIRDLKRDYTKLDKLAQRYKESRVNKEESEADIVPGCESVCSNLAKNPEKADECNKCSKEHSNDELEEPEKSGERPVERGYTSTKLNDKCNGLNPCVEIDRAGIGVVARYDIGKETYAKCDRGDYPGEKGMRYFICSCRCKEAIRATYECKRAGSPTYYYYSYCKESKDKTSQGGYIYEFHNFSGGAYKLMLGSATSEIPIFMLGQGPTFKDYELAKKLCKPSNPADVTITAGKLPFVPANVTVIEGGQLCFVNNGLGAHRVYYPLMLKIIDPKTKTLRVVPVDVTLANLTGGGGSCAKTGEGTNLTVGEYKLYIDDNKVATATVKVVKPANARMPGVVKLDARGQPVFLYNGELELDAIYASGTAGADTMSIIESDGSVRKVSAVAGEHVDRVGKVKFSYVAYEKGDKITISGEGEPLFTPRAIVLPLGSKLCVINAVEGTAKNLLLERKVNYTPETYVPVAAKRSLYGLECCFDIPDAGVYRVSDADYLQGMKAYVVVFPSNVAPLITVNDYGYTPISSLVKRDDYVCITNPVGADRDITYTSDKGSKGTFKVKALEDYCTYGLTKEDANYNFTDMLTGAKFYLSVASGSVLNVDVHNRMFIPANGRIDKGGQVCLNAVGSNVILVFARVQSTAAISGQQATGEEIRLAPGQKRCVTINDAGLYTFRNKDNGLDLLVAVGGKDTAYIVKGNVVYTPVDVEFPDYVSASTNPLYIDVFTQYPKVTLHNLDAADYAVYNELTIRNGTGFSAQRLDLVAPQTIIYNKAPYNVTIKITSRSFSKSGRTITIPTGKYAIYTYDSNAGDYLITSVTNLNVKKIEGSPEGFGTKVELSADRMIDDKGIVLKGGSSKEITVRSVGGALVSLFSFKGALDNPSSQPEKKGTLLIRGSVQGGESVALSKLNVMKTLGFGVQTISGVPTSDELMAARSMLAIDNAIPVFLYSRIGKVSVNLVDPTATETYRISTGTLVKATLDKDIDKQMVTVSDQGIDPAKYNTAGRQWIFNMPPYPVTFTIKKGNAEKKVELAPTAAIKEVRMSYTQYRVDTHGNENYMIRVHNLAVEPRAIMLRPSKIDEYCQISEKEIQADLPRMWSSLKMQVYDIQNKELNALENHDPFVGKGVSKITDIILLPNMGYRDITLELGRQPSTNGSVGQLTLKANPGSNVSNTQASKLVNQRFELSPGFVSGLNKTQAVRLYRIFSNKTAQDTTLPYKYMDVKLGTDVYGSDKYTVIARRLAPGVSIPEKQFTGNTGVWKGTVFAEKYYNLLPRVWKSEWEGNKLWSGCGSSTFIVPFSNKIYPKEFAYSAPAIFGFMSMKDFPEEYNNYALMHTRNYNYPVLPQVVGKINYKNYSFHYADHNVQDIDFTSRRVSSQNIVPSAIRLTNGEVLTEFGLVFYDEINADVPCGRIYIKDKFSETGDLFTNYNGDFFTDTNRFKCGTGTNDYKDDYEAAIKNIGFFIGRKSCVIYNKYGGYCMFGDESGVNNDNDIYLKNVLWCRVANTYYARKATAIGASKYNWNIANVLKGIGKYPAGSGSYNEVIELNLDGAYGSNIKQDFIIHPYYQFTDPGCVTGKDEYKTDNVIGAQVKGGVDESMFAGGMMFLFNDVSPAKRMFDKLEILPGTSEMSMGYAITDTFSIASTIFSIGEKAVCYGDSTFDGIQDVIAPLAMNTYMPDTHGEYAVYESPYYPNFKTTVNGEVVSYYHLSPFATDSGSGNRRESLEQAKLGTVTYDVPQLSYNGRLYRDARLSINDIFGKGDILKDGKERVADVYLYNLTVGAVVNGVVTSVDAVDVAEGDLLLLNNTGNEPIVWYYGIITPCIKDDDIEDKIAKKMNTTCNAGGEKDCIKNPKTYSISPIDMDNYLKDVSASSPQFVSRLEIAPREKRIVQTSLESNAPNSIKLVLPPGEQSATYLFYNPYSGKRMSVRISRQVESILLQVNSFSPPSVSIQQGGADSELCILNRDKAQRKIVYEKPDGTVGKEVSIQPGSSDCNQPSYFDTYRAKDPVTGKYLGVNKGRIGSQEAISMLENITREVALSKEGADNPAYKFQLLNPKAPATPAIITTELIDIDGITQQDYASLAKEIETIESVCRGEKSFDRQQCKPPVSSSSENVEVSVEYDDVKLTGCCCRQVGPSTECKRGITEAECNALKKFDKRWNYAQCPVGCCCPRDKNDGKCTFDVSQNQCKDEYTYFCPTTSKVYKQRCISTLPFFVHVRPDKTGVTAEQVRKMKEAIDAVYGELKASKSLGSSGEKLDLIGYVVVIDDPGIDKRGQCTLAGYIDGLRNVSQYAATKYGIPSIIIGFGLNRNVDEKKSCWSNTELSEQARQLFTEDILMMVGSGIIGMGQYCLVDTSCKPVTSGVAGADYGLYYDTKTTGVSPFAYGINRPDVTIGGVTSLSDYLKALPADSFSDYYEKPRIVLPTRTRVYYDVKKFNIRSGNVTYTGVKPLASNTGMLGGLTLQDQVSGLAGNTNIPGTGLLSGYLGYLDTAGISISGLGEGSMSLTELIDAFNKLNNPSLILGGTVRKDPYARVWFDQCGKYYYEGEGQTLIIFSETDIPKGQQGNPCDPSRMMELYKKYKCE